MSPEPNATKTNGAGGGGKEPEGRRRTRLRAGWVDWLRRRQAPRGQGGAARGAGRPRRRSDPAATGQRREPHPRLHEGPGGSTTSLSIPTPSRWPSNTREPSGTRTPASWPRSRSNDASVVELGVTSTVTRFSSARTPNQLQGRCIVAKSSYCQVLENHVHPRQLNPEWPRAERPLNFEQLPRPRLTTS